MTEIATAPAGPSIVRLPRRMPPNFLAMAFGLAGLGEAWAAARPVLSLPQAVPDVFLGASALLWAVLVSVYVAQGWHRVLADVRDRCWGRSRRWRSSRR